MKKLIFVIIALASISCEKKEFRLISPSSSLEMHVFVSKDGELNYNILLESDTVIRDSPLGLELDKISFVHDLHFIDYSISEVKSETIDMLTGKKKEINNSYREGIIEIENANRDVLFLVVRAYDDGVAFRYKLAADGSTKYLVKEEATGFNIAEGDAWLMPYDDPAPYTPAYEAYYEDKLNSNAQSPTNSGWAFPALFHTNHSWILLTEADVNETYCSVHLNSPINGLYTIRFPEEKEASGLYSSLPQITSSWESPWRVIMVGEKLNSIVENNLVQSLASPSSIDDTSWIKPGIASWSWWWDNDSPEDYEKLKAFVDFGNRMGWKHSLIDAKWDIMRGGSIEDLCEYATSKDVCLWVWYNSGGAHNSYELGPRDILHTSELRRKEFERISQMGVKGIKVDYIESDKQDIIRLYTDILKDAADYKLMVNFHGCKLPTGWERTYPNLLTMEAVKGAEGYKLDATYPRRAAVCNTILPYTRNVVGPMDYTPTTFSAHLYPHETSFGHELALSVIFESGVQHMADDYRMYEKQPDFVVDFMKTLPSTWDETLLIDGYPGKDIIMSRKKNDKWFIAGISSREESVQYLLKLPFLTEKMMKLTLISDGTDNKSFKKEIYEVDKDSEIAINMLPQGGFCGIVE